jgi:4-amino-4-deoxy-L-arabinose transferase-like glycosyltransferase
VCLIAALVTAIAAVWYTRRLDAVPVYLQHDEVNFAIQAHAIATSGRDAGGQSLPLYFREQGFEIGRDPIYIYLAAAALSVLPPEEHTLRLPSVLAALLSIFLTVLVAYELFGSATAAIVAGLLLATSPALFIHGRKALSVIFPIPFVTW